MKLLKNQPQSHSLLAEMKTEREKWEATSAGIMYKKWQASPEGEKVLCQCC